MAAAVFDDENEVNSSPAFSVTISRENCKCTANAPSLMLGI